MRLVMRQRPSRMLLALLAAVAAPPAALLLLAGLLLLPLARIALLQRPLLRPRQR